MFCDNQFNDKVIHNSDSHSDNKGDNEPLVAGILEAT